MKSNFFSMVLRMKYINRWGLMHNTRNESLSEHSIDVAILTHVLCIISNKRLGNNIDANKGAMIALFHDASEIITGDMPTPIKYMNPDIKNAYKQVEEQAVETLLSKLPADFLDEYTDLFKQSTEDEYLWKLVKGADKLSALIKCVEEEKSGNTEFKIAKLSTMKSINCLKLKELDIFMDEFFDGFTQTLDENFSV